MEMLQVQLPPMLAQRIRQALPTDEALNQFFAEAIQLRLEKQPEEKTHKEETVRLLRKAGLVMSAEKQRIMAETMRAKLSISPKPSLAEVEASLANFKIPLSEEILAMRGER
ncbi:MAG: hypothetical protein AAB354_02695 [candidate division KSB1 bacterium]